MSDRFIGPGGSNSNNGLTWATRWLDFTNVTAANFPTNANRRCLVGPGVYRFTATKSMPTASSGFLHEYIGDYSGALTDSVGGEVRLTSREASNSDYAHTGTLLSMGNCAFVVLRNFIFDAFQQVIVSQTADNFTIENCVFNSSSGNQNAASGVKADGNSVASFVVRNCLFTTTSRSELVVAGGNTALTATNSKVENCLATHALSNISNHSGWLINACTTFSSHSVRAGIRFNSSGQSGTVKNCYLVGTGVEAHTTNSVVEDYNIFASGDFAARTNVTAGSNSLAGAVAMPYFSWSPLFSGGGVSGATGIMSTMRHLRLQFFSPTSSLSSPDTDMPTTDFFGLKRPTALAKRTTGAIQRQPVSRVTSPVHTGSYSLRFSDAGRYQVLVPYTGSGQRTVSVRVQRQTDYSGSNLPGMVIKQPYQADITVADTGGTGTWNEVTHTFTPAALPKWYVVELFSDNEATSGAYEVYFDTFVVT